MFVRIVIIFFFFFSVQTIMASEVQIIENEEAYRLYKELPGVACQEYRAENYIVYTKYQTNFCHEEQTDPNMWNCTVQYELKNGKIEKWISAVCSREI
jgi:hypothetical protein